MTINLHIRARDALGIDTTAPTQPSSLTATPNSATQINLVWGASTDLGSGVAFYLLERSLNQIDWAVAFQGNALSFNDTGLNASTQYFYQVRAQDVSGNISTARTANATTQSAGGGNQTAVVADWQRRQAGPGVIWAHGFESDTEVNNFRWTNDFGSGNDPNAAGGYNAALVRRITTDGTDKGNGPCCLEIVHPDGTADGSHWWRPFSPMLGGTTTGNGKGASNPDQAANGTMTRRSWNPVPQGSQTSGWGADYFGSSQGGNGPWTYSGSEYYLQMRVKLDHRRIEGAANQAIDVGKLIFITRTDRSNTDQKIIVYAMRQVGNDNYFGMYNATGGDLPLDQHAPGIDVHGNNPGTEWGFPVVGDGQCRLDNNGGRLANCYKWPNPNDWATVMWHVIPGTNLGSNTLIEVFAALPGQTEFTQIWRQTNANLGYDPDHPQGHNALMCSVYENGGNMTEFYQRYDQILLSKDYIPCPKVYDSSGESLALTAYALGVGQSTNFNAGIQSGFSLDTMEWETHCHYDERHGLIHMMGKPANSDQAWSHQYFTTRTNAWTVVSTSMWNNQGHIYGNFAIDPLTGDLFQTRGNADFPAGHDFPRRARWWKYSLKSSGVAAWGQTLPTNADFWIGGDNSIVSHMNGVVYHPHLYGRNDGALIIDNQFETIFVRKSTDTATFVSHNVDQYGDKESDGVYWQAQNVALVGGGNGSPGRMLRVAPNATPGGAPVLTDISGLPIPVGGHSRLDGSFGSIHVHPGNPNKLIILETNGQRVWTGTMSGNSITWTQVANHPFTAGPRIVCPIHGAGVFLSFGTNTCVMWKPAP